MKRLETNENESALSGGVVVLRRSIDPDFFLNTKLADRLSKALHLAIEVKEGIAYGKGLNSTPL